MSRRRFYQGGVAKLRDPTRPKLRRDPLGSVPYAAVQDQLNLGLLVLRLCLGLFMAYHGYNKVFGPGGLSGTTGWFGSMGFKFPAVQAKVAAGTEIGAGLLLATGLLTPLAAAGLVGLMTVAIITVHWKVGFFIFKPNQGWEYCGTIALAAFAVGVMGPGEWSLDNAIDFHLDGWGGALVAGLLGVGGALAQLAAFYRPPKATA
jgi:putative oxidoreductase